MWPAAQDAVGQLLDLVEALEAMHSEDVTKPVPFERGKARRAVFAKAREVRAELAKKPEDVIAPYYPGGGL